MLINIICNKYIKHILSVILLILVHSCQNKQGTDVKDVRFDAVKESENFSPLEARLTPMGQSWVMAPGNEVNTDTG